MATVKRVGRYELGQTLGEGTFAKVKFATDTETQTHYAIKVFSREQMASRNLQSQIKKEIAIMKHVRHPNVVNLREVLASKTHVYIVLELVTGGELFDRIVTAGKLEERHARVYFQQLMDGVAYCHERGVCHRDLKPENLLLDAAGRLKISDFGLSSLPEHHGQSMESLQTTCGTPNYVAPEVLRGQGYDGRSADVWSCGCILYVLTAGGMPFDEPQLASLFLVIANAKFKIPAHFSAPLRDLIERILVPNPKLRITVAEIRAHEWFTPGYVQVVASYDGADVAASDDAFVEVEVVRADASAGGAAAARPAAMTAFDLIGTASGLDLSAMFEKGASTTAAKRPTRFASMCDAPEILRALEAAATALHFAIPGASRNFKLRMEGHSRRGPLVALAQVFEMCPGLYMVEVRKVRGDTIEFNEFYKRLEERCAPIVLAPGGGSSSSGPAAAASAGAEATAAVAVPGAAAAAAGAGDRQPLLARSI